MNKKQNLFRHVMWFDKRLKFDIDFFEALQPQRIVSSKPRYKSGVFYSEKCRREIQYESGIELDFIQFLEQSDNVLFYYEQPVRIRYFRGRRKANYIPDFGVYLKSKEFVLVEIKNLSTMVDHRVQMRMEGLLKFCSQKGFGLLLTDGKYTIDKLKKTKINRALEKEVLLAIDKDTLRKKECNLIMKRCQSTQNDLLKVIMKHHLKYRSFPFKIQHGNRNEMFRQVFIYKKRYDELIGERFSELFE